MVGGDHDTELWDELDALTAQHDWPGMLRWRERHLTTSFASPIMSTCDYRLTIGAPGAIVGGVLQEPSAPAVIGPLTEVAAQHHRYADVARYLTTPALLSALAHERTLRGEDVRSHAPPATDLPLARQPWEPHYLLADYNLEVATFPSPRVPSFSPQIRLPSPGEAIGDPHVVDVFKDLVHPWTAQSNGAVQIVTVEGDHLNAIAALGGTRARLAEVSFAEALSWMAWAGSSGGARGLRPGSAAGRTQAWWCVAALAGVSEDWPIDPAELGEIGEGLHWYLWDADEPAAPWQLRLAVHDDIEELGLAITASDHDPPSNGPE